MSQITITKSEQKETYPVQVSKLKYGAYMTRLKDSNSPSLYLVAYSLEDTSNRQLVSVLAPEVVHPDTFEVYEPVPVTLNFEA